MAKRLFYRLIGAALVLLAVSFVTFVALATAPGDAALALAGDSASAEQLDALRADLGLNLPIVTRYAGFLEGAITRGDLGRSVVSGRSVAGLLLERLPYTVGLALAATLLAAVIGATAGTLAALRAGTAWDTIIMGGALVGLAVPSFWLALLFIMLFSLKLDWLPVVGAETPRHAVLPILTLALPTSAIVARLMRGGLLSVLGKDYIRTAHAKGVPPRQVLTRHALRNSIVPLLTVLGTHLGHLLGGAFVVETIFGWPGLGRLAVQGIFDRDYPVVLGAALTVAAVYLLLNLAVDFAQALLDPRVAQEAI
jgi:ABC-type dipeptide/oligopeptide/nickel transport system permease component